MITSTTSKKLRVLVVEDTSRHQISARRSLVEHDLTVVSSYDEAMRLMDDKKSASFDAVLTDLFMPPSAEKLSPRATYQYSQHEPVGLGIALLAAYKGVRYVAVVSDMDHHQHPFAAMLDRLIGGSQWEDCDDNEGWVKVKKTKPNFIINGAIVGFFHAPHTLINGLSGCSWQCDQGKSEEGKPCEMCEGTGFARGKDWAKVLTRLMEHA